MKEVRQFRYYGDNSQKNYPLNLSKELLCNENIFEAYGNVIQIGIQGIPGTIFYLNNGEHPLMIGSTGIYELNLEGLTSLTAIQFNEQTLNEYSDGTNGLIIDIII